MLVIRVLLFEWTFHTSQPTYQNWYFMRHPYPSAGAHYMSWLDVGTVIILFLYFCYVWTNMIIEKKNEGFWFKPICLWAGLWFSFMTSINLLTSLQTAREILLKRSIRWFYMINKLIIIWTGIPSRKNVFGNWIKIFIQVNDNSKIKGRKAKIGTKSTDQRSMKLIMPLVLSLVTFLCFSGNTLQIWSLFG